MLGLFSQEKLIPLRYCPIQIELELVNQQSDAVTTAPTEGFGNGVKVMKFNLTGDQWLDPSTFRVASQFDNHNGVNANDFQIMVQPLSWNPAVFFRRARLICGGQVVEDIDDFNRLSLMLTDLMPEDDRNDICLLYTSPSPRDVEESRMPSSA